MTTSNKKAIFSALDPTSRISEILFGLIMVMTFTSSVKAADFVADDVGELLIAALGCNLAWGIIDAVMFLMNVAAERGREALLINNIYKAKSISRAKELIQETLPESLSELLSDRDLEHLTSGLKKLPSIEPIPLLTWKDLRASLIVFALVFLTIFPVSIPFLLMEDPWRALRVSNLISLVLLFGLGHELGRYAGRPGWRWGLGMAVIGAILVGIAVRLGG